LHDSPQLSDSAAPRAAFGATLLEIETSAHDSGIAEFNFQLSLESSGQASLKLSLPYLVRAAAFAAEKEPFWSRWRLFLLGFAPSPVK